MIQTKTPSQGLLFSEPLYTETGVWIELNPGIEPEEWASLCRHIGNLCKGRSKIAADGVVKPRHPSRTISPDTPCVKSNFSLFIDPAEAVYSVSGSPSSSEISVSF